MLPRKCRVQLKCQSLVAKLRQELIALSQPIRLESQRHIGVMLILERNDMNTMVQGNEAFTWSRISLNILVVFDESVNSRSNP